MEPSESLNAPKKDYNAPAHTTEHVLNRTMDSMFHCGRAFSAHVEARKSKCDYHFAPDKVPGEADLKAVEEKVNEILRKNLSVTSVVVSREEASVILEPYGGLLEERLPEEAGNMLRLVYVGDYDVCPCIGKHVENTSETGVFKIISSSYENGVFRLRWKLLPQAL